MASAEAQVLQSQLAEIGIKLDIKLMELNVYVDAWLKGDFDMAVALNGGRPDPYTMYNRYFMEGGRFLNVSNYVDETLDTLMNEGRVETEHGQAQGDLPEVRKAIWPRCRPGSGCRLRTFTPPSSRPFQRVRTQSDRLALSR